MTARIRVAILALCYSLPIAPAVASSCVPADTGMTSRDCLFRALQLATTDQRLSDDISAGYWASQESLPGHASPRWYNNGSPERQADLRALARHRMWHFRMDLMREMLAGHVRAADYVRSATLFQSLMAELAEGGR